ncbi:cytochrome b [Fulvimonas yonginensis]|uniref:Cytochrome b/b6 domain-containing protein n=1 Tax=Fulvimonas yonginensis TaxID=1495200 RepID=A0ABU8JAX3_9GAMM
MSDCEGGVSASAPLVGRQADQARASTDTSPRARPRLVVALHWLTVLALLLAAAVILARAQVGGRALRAALLEIHRHLGLAVLLLFALRIAVRLRLGPLPDPGCPSRPLRAAAELTHAALYGALLVLPMLGWMLSNAEGKPVDLLGLPLPQLVPPDLDLADELLVWHQGAAWALLALTLLHVAAALWHHFVRRDGVLRAMGFRTRD